MIKKGTKLTAEQVKKLRDGKKNFDSHIQDGLAQILTSDWIDYDEMHRAINRYMTEQIGRPIDLEYININVALRIFAKSCPLEWKIEKTGQYASQRKSFVKIKN